MKAMAKKWKEKQKDEAGFTLIEILIVVILLGILATIIIPQVSVSSDDAKLNATKTNLGHMRSAIELYYYQHNDTYPGQNDNTGSGTSNAGAAATAFKEQLTQYTDVNGDVEVTKDSTYKYGPYVKGGDLPTNPYNDKNTVVCDATETDITEKTSGGTAGWKFYTQTGILMADDGSHDSL